MRVRWIGGPLDGLQCEMEQRDIQATMTARSYKPDNPGHPVTGYWPEEDRRMIPGESAHYRARRWWSGVGESARFLCIEYIYVS